MTSLQLTILISLLQLGTTNEYLNSCNDEKESSIQYHYPSYITSAIQCNPLTNCSIHREPLESSSFSSVYPALLNNDIQIIHKHPTFSFISRYAFNLIQLFVIALFIRQTAHSDHLLRISFLTLIPNVYALNTTALAEVSQPSQTANTNGGFIATIIIFIILSATANVVCIYFFYWKYRKEAQPNEPTKTKTEIVELKTKEAIQTTIDINTQEKELKEENEEEPKEEVTEAKEPVWNHYLQIIVPFTFLIEDFAAIGLEDSEKTVTVNIALVITLQFLSAMIISWCRECCTRSVLAINIPKVLNIIMEYVFAIVLISFCKYVAFAAFIIGGLTILQVMVEIMSIIFENELGFIFVLPPCCKWMGRSTKRGRSCPYIIEVLHRKVNGLPDLPKKSDKPRFTFTTTSSSGTKTTKSHQEPEEEKKGGWLRPMTIFMFIGVFFFLFGAIYVESGCFDNGFKYWWAFGMFLYDQLWETPALDIWINAAKWRKVLLVVQFVVMVLFMFITTVLTTFSEDQEQYEGCESGVQETFTMASVYLYVGCFLLFAALCMKAQGRL